MSANLTDRFISLSACKRYIGNDVRRGFSAFVRNKYEEFGRAIREANIKAE
jgi:hypothetical protein